MTDELPGVKIDLSEDAKANDVKAAEVEAPEGQEIETTKPEEGSALATDTETAPEEKAEGGGETNEQDRVQQAINKQHRKYREEERAHEETRRQLEAAKAELARQQGSDIEPNIPPQPDPYDENYAELMKARDDALVAHAEWKGRQKQRAEDAQQAEQQAFIERQKKLADDADAYQRRGQELGINQDSLNKASEIVAGYGIPDSLVTKLLTDQDGPLMTQYLATDLLQLGEVAKLMEVDPFSAAQLIEREIRPKAQALKPKPTGTPPPPDTLAGAGPGEDILGPHKGVTIK